MKIKNSSVTEYNVSVQPCIFLLNFFNTFHPQQILLIKIQHLDGMTVKIDHMTKTDNSCVGHQKKKKSFCGYITSEL